MTLTLFGYDPTVTVSTLGGTFTRADATTCATYVDSNGVVQTVAANVLRNAHYVNGVRTTLLEGSRTNGLTQTSDLSVGSILNNATISADSTTAPDGTATADKLQEDATAGVEHGVSRNAALPATTVSTLQSVSVWVKSAERTWCILSTVNRDGAIWRTWFNLATGAYGTTNANHTARVLVTPSVATGWYRLGITFNSGAAAGGLQFAVNASTADNTLAYNGVAGNGIYVWGRQWEADQAFPSSFIATAGAAVTRAADVLSFPFLPVPQASTFFFSGYDLMAGANLYAMGLAKSDGSAPQINIQGNGSAKYLVTTNNGSANVSSTPNQTVAFGDGIEFRGVLNADGSVLGGISDNSAAEVLGSTSGANTLAAQWGGVSNPVLGVAQLGNAGSSVGFVAVRKIVIASGVQSLATMRTLSATGSGATITNTLAQVAPAAEIAAFGQPGFTCMDSGTNTALSAAYTPAATQQARLFTLTVDYSAAPAAGPITVQDGETVLWRYDLSATGPFQQTFDFTRKPLRASKGAVLSVNAASPGSGVQGMITWTGDVVRAP